MTENGITTQIETLMQKVENILSLYPKARDDDKYLTLTLWWKFHREVFWTYTVDFKPVQFISANQILELPSQDFIARCRRKIQEQGYYLPTTWEVAKRRKINETAWKSYMIITSI